VEAAVGAQRAAAVAAPAVVAAGAAAVVVALAVLAAEAAVEAVASAVESAARCSAATAEPVVQPAALRHPHHLGADRDVPRAAAADQQAPILPAVSSMAQLSVLSWPAVVPTANRDSAGVPAEAEAATAAAPAMAQPTAPVRRPARRAAGEFLVGRARFSRVVAEQ
jgi:hypothetical protein